MNARCDRSLPAPPSAACCLSDFARIVQSKNEDLILHFGEQHAPQTHQQRVLTKARGATDKHSSESEVRTNTSERRPTPHIVVPLPLPPPAFASHHGARDQWRTRAVARQSGPSPGAGGCVRGCVPGGWMAQDSRGAGIEQDEQASSSRRRGGLRKELCGCGVTVVGRKLDERRRDLE